MTALPLLVLVLALLLGVPIAVALAGSGMLGIYLVTGDFCKVMGILSLTPFSTVADYALTTIPMFILMAFFSASSGLARDLYTAAANWLSHIRGGLAIATVFACGIFGAMSGREHGRGLGNVEDRDAGDAPPRLFGRTGGRRDRHRRNARHSDPAQHRDGDLRHRDADLDRQAADRRRHSGDHRRRPARAS